MSSVLNVDTIVDKAGSGGTNVKVGNTSTYVADGGSATQNLVQGLVKVWLDEGGDGASIGDSLNVASFTDSGTGQGYAVFTNNMGNTNYSQFNFDQWQDFDTGSNAYAVSKGNKETNRCRTLHYENKTLTDPADRNIMVAGDLA
tara:strand:+ start:133 stop:564 length:432 start_codon:yes stop_codon:yes gene_type:complete